MAVAESLGLDTQDAVALLGNQRSEAHRAGSRKGLASQRRNVDLRNEAGLEKVDWDVMDTRIQAGLARAVAVEPQSLGLAFTARAVFGNPGLGPVFSSLDDDGLPSIQ